MMDSSQDPLSDFSIRSSGKWAAVATTLDKDTFLRKVRTGNRRYGLVSCPEGEIITPAIWPYIYTARGSSWGVFRVREFRGSYTGIDRSGLALEEQDYGY